MGTGSLSVRTSAWSPLFDPDPHYGRRNRSKFVSGPPLPDTISEAILSLEPLGYWKLDETSGTTAADSSGNGRDGTYTGAGGVGLGTAAGMDGGMYASFGSGGTIGANVQIADADDWSLNTHGGLTFFALVTGGATTGSRYLALKSGFNQSEWAMGKFSGTASGRVWRPNGDVIASVISPSVAGESSWYALAWTVPSSPVTDLATKWFYNATTPNGTPTTGNTAGIYANGTAPMRIGGSSSTGQSWGGAIAHFAVFTPRLDNEIAMLMTVASNEGWLASLN